MKKGLFEKVKDYFSVVNWKITGTLMALGLGVELIPDAILLGAGRLIDDTGDIIQILIIPIVFFYLGRKLSISYQKLKEAKALYKGLFQNAPFGIVIIDPDTTAIDQANFKAANQLGYTLEEFIGMKVFDLDNIEDKDQVRRRINNIEESGNGEFETLQKAKNGELKDIRVIARFIRIRNKQVYMCVWEDITESKRLEQKLRNAERMEAIGTIAGGVAHDLNNILGSIISYPEILLLNSESFDNKQSRMLNKILKAGQKAAVIVSDLLTWTRSGVLASEVLDLNVTINEYLNSPEYLEMQKEFPNVKFEISLTQVEHHIKGSPVHLSKAIMNMVNNAAEAIQGEGKVEISSSAVFLDKNLRAYEDIPAGNYMVLNVKDTGHGLKHEDIKKIFEPFYTKKKMGRSGTGLGMTIVYSTVKDHGGYIHIESNEQAGTCISLYFPITYEKISKEGLNKDLEDMKGHGEIILVVDDMQEQLDLSVKILGILNYNVHTVTNGDKAIEYLNSHYADIILLDMVMDPGISGIETYNRIMELRPTQKVVFVSGYSNPDQIIEVQKLGMPFVKKPFTMDKIAEALNEQFRTTES